MREVTIEGKTFEVRPLKRREVKELRKQGFKMERIDQDKMEDHLDTILEMIFPGRIAELDELAPKHVNHIFEHILKESFGARDEEKN